MALLAVVALTVILSILVGSAFLLIFLVGRRM